MSPWSDIPRARCPIHCLRSLQEIRSLTVSGGRVKRRPEFRHGLDGAEVPKGVLCRVVPPVSLLRIVLRQRRHVRGILPVAPAECRCGSFDPLGGGSAVREEPKALVSGSLFIWVRGRTVGCRAAVPTSGGST